MKIKRKDLLNVLNSVKPGIDTSKVLEQRTHFIFTGEDVMTYNGEVSILCPFESDFQCSVKSDDLLNALSKSTSEMVTIIVDKGKMIITLEGRNFGLSVFTEEAHAEILDSMLEDLSALEDENGWSSLPEDFIYGASLCIFSASKDRTGGDQNTLYAIRVDGKNLYCTDNLRGSHFEMCEAMGDFLIDINHIINIIKYPIVSWAHQNSRIYFSTEDNLIFMANTILGQYPDFTKLFNFEGETLELPDGLKEAINHVVIMAEGDTELDRNAEICIKNNILICKTKKDTGWGEAKLDMDYTGEEIIFNVNPAFLSQVLEKTNKIKVGASAFRAQFSLEGFRHLMMLRR